MEPNHALQRPSQLPPSVASKPPGAAQISLLPTARAAHRSSFSFDGQNYDLTNPMIFGVVALFEGEYNRTAYVPNIFGEPVRIVPGRWSAFKDAMRNAWCELCNDAVANRQPWQRGP